MYEAFFGLHEKPFSLTPDPAYFYRSDSHANAIDLIRHGISHQKGPIVLTGTSGAGKTTLCRTVLEELDRNTFTALVLNPYLSEEDLLLLVLQEFGVISRDEVKRGRMAHVAAADLRRTLIDFLQSLPPLGARAILIVDEAQKLPPAVMQQIRALAALATAGRPLLQIVLAGQLQLRDTLRQPALRDLDARVAIRYRVRPLLAAETAAYVTHRLAIAGARSTATFTPKALQHVHRASGGNPRLINILCDRALLAACSVRAPAVDAEQVYEAAARFGLEPPSGSVLGWLRRVAAL
ncbi:MAG TPA: AAA family ATPase [Vicinamibacterales bacterium]|nr:AAA family ATPase [Vicinamibacterales bacterium]